MTLGIIEVNDAGLRYGEMEPETTVIESPGIALVNGKQLLLGQAALQQARLQPLNTNSQFWHRLSAEPLAQQNSQYRHHADLAYSQLLDLHQQNPSSDQIVFALPGSFTREQMSLLLGIVGQCPFTATALVDSAVAAASVSASNPKVVFVELQLHQLVLTLLSAGERIKREAVELVPRAGVFALRDKWAKFLADQFIEQSRFDPLHSASTEQALYDRLPSWLQLANAEDDLFLESAGKTAKVSRHEFLQPVRDICQLIVAKAQQLAGDTVEILFSDRFQHLPGLNEQLAGFSTRLTVAPRLVETNAVLQGVRTNVEGLLKESSQGLTFIQSLPFRGLSAPPSVKASTAPSGLFQTPTHLLSGGEAWPLTHHTLFLTKAVEPHSAPLSQQQTGESVARIEIGREGIALLPLNSVGLNSSLQVNGEAVRDNVTLRVGDRIHLNDTGQVFQVIHVHHAG